MKHYEITAEDLGITNGGLVRIKTKEELDAECGGDYRKEFPWIVGSMHDMLGKVYEIPPIEGGRTTVRINRYYWKICALSNEIDGTDAAWDPSDISELIGE